MPSFLASGSPSSRAARSPLLAAAATLLVAGPLCAQTVRGRLLERGTAVPVEGALVELRTTADSVVDRTITDPDGGYVVQGQRAGRYVLEAERIGYRSWRSEPFALADGQGVSRILHMPTEAVRLEDLDVRARSACERAGSGRRGAPVARVWDQIRKALTLTSLSAGATSRWVFVKRFYSRARVPRTRRVVYDSTSVDTARGTRPFHALPAERLVRRGFVEPDTGSRPTYYGPSAGTLVSGAFLDTHCMTLTGPEEHDGERWIGLAFRPVEGRNVSDIAGTLWLTEQASELRRLDFRYVHVRLPKEAADVAGGRVDFLRLPTGAWIVSGYRLDLPMLAKGQEPGGASTTRGASWRPWSRRVAKCCRCARKRDDRCSIARARPWWGR